MIRMLHGDCRSILPTLEANSVHAVVTSPPYYALRSYLDADHPDKHREIGSERTPDEYLATMVQVFREVRRILRNDGVMFVNLGDSYSGGGGYWPDAPSNRAGSKQATNAGSVAGNRNSGLPAKNLMMMPARLAIALQADGWWLRSMLPWLKRSAMPESVTDRPASAVEYVFLLTKSARYFWDGEAVKRGIQASSLERGYSDAYMNGVSAKMKAAPDDVRAKENWRENAYVPAGRSMRNSDLFYDSLEMPDETQEQRGRVSPQSDDRGVGAAGGAAAPALPLGLICSDDGAPLALDVNPAAFSSAHFATFPPKLVEPLIRAGTSERGCCAQCGAPWVRQVRKSGGTIGTHGIDYSADRGGRLNVGVSFAKDLTDYKVETTGWSPGCAHDAAVVPCVVLDPFSGAGTTLLVADRLQRDAIGIELNPAYGAMADARVVDDAPLLAWGAAQLEAAE